MIFLKIGYARVSTGLQNLDLQEDSLIEPLMTKVTRFLGIEHTCKRISLLTAVSLIYQAIPVVPTVFDDWI